MRIVFDTRPLQTPSRSQGIGTVVRGTLQALAALDRDNEYRLLRWRGPEPPPMGLPADFRWKWLEVPRCRPRQVGWLYDRKMLGGWLKGAGDIAHFWSPFDLDMGWPLRGPVPNVMTVYDMIPVLHARETLTGKHRLLRPWFARMARDLSKASRLLCISHSTAEDLTRVVGEEAVRGRVQVLTLGLDGAFRSHSEADIEEFCRQRGLQRPFLLYVGSLRPNKNLPMLLQALARLPRIPTLAVATNNLGRGAAVLQKLAAELGIQSRVRWLERTSLQEVAAAYSAARVLVLPSLFEGFGLPVAEAMACGTAVACSAIPPLQEVGQQAVRTFDPRSVDSMASVLSQVWEDERLRQEMCAAGHLRSQVFRWETCARQTLECYRSLGSPGT